MVKGSIVSSAARPARIGRFEGSGSFSGLARVAGLTLKQPTVYFLAPLPRWIFSGREPNVVQFDGIIGLRHMVWPAQRDSV
jgi:hypothetical protein